MKKQSRTKNTKSARQCNTPMCDGDASKYPQLGVCHACYQAVRYATMRGPAWILHRQRNLAKFAARIDSLSPANVVDFRDRKRATR